MSMIKGIFAALCIFATGCSYPIWNAKVERPYDINDAFKSVVKIGMDVTVKGVLQGTVSGTAWAIDSNHLITASHVCMAFVEIRDAGVGKDIKVTYLDSSFDLQEKVADVEILFSDAANDVCLMKYKGHGLLPLKLAPGVVFGEKVYVVGAPLGLLGFVFEGRVANRGLDLSPTMRNKLIISSAATGGNSGGPVINDRGEVIGILIAGMARFDHFSICTGLGALMAITKVLE